MIRSHRDRRQGILSYNNNTLVATDSLEDGTALTEAQSTISNLSKPAMQDHKEEWPSDAI